jgi:outer membrane receptor for Fe3+-dicitrate
MISREEYNKALDIVEAYHKQLFLCGVVRSFKPLSEVSIGDYVKCKTIHQSSTKCITIGKKYKVFDVYDTGYKGFLFYIIDDNGKKRKYFDKNSQFEIAVD